jgi:hypothetical protein
MKTFKQYLGEDLRQWFKQKWVRMDTKGNIKGDCAREPGEGKPKCLPQAKAHAIGKEARASAAQRKRREDPNPERRGKPINVATEEVESIDEKNVPTSPEKWARAKAAAKSKFAVYPSAYANGWASKKYKSMGGGWRTEETVSEDGMGGGAVAVPGPTNVTGVATSTDPISATAVNRKKKITPILLSIRRKPPKG